MVEVTCSYCRKVYLRSQNRVNEAIKFNWKPYCSLKCLKLGRIRQKTFSCSNPSCTKTFKRLEKEISQSGKVFCSQSSAAITSNKDRALKTPKKYCLNPACKKIIPNKNIYCSVKCQMALVKFSDVEYKARIIDRIQKFYRENKRIPFKQEMWGIYQPSRRLFGTWNKTIVAAGFIPNPVKFANKYIANDGHKCDSLAEKIIDDWLTARKIKHERNVLYGLKKYTADFKVGDTYIEFFGLHGELESYDVFMKNKLNYIRMKKLKIISIFPKDLFPKCTLEQKLKIIKPVSKLYRKRKRKRLSLSQISNQKSKFYSCQISQKFVILSESSSREEGGN